MTCEVITGLAHKKFEPAYFFSTNRVYFCKIPINQ